VEQLAARWAHKNGVTKKSNALHYGIFLLQWLIL